MLLAVQRQVVFIALVHVHAGYIVQCPFVLDNVVRGNVGTVIDEKMVFPEPCAAHALLLQRGIRAVRTVFVACV